MKTPDLIRADITRRLASNWHHDITGGTVTWPHSFPLGKPTKSDLDTDYGTFHRHVLEWQDWARVHQVAITYTNRHVLGTTQIIPTHATVPDLATAAKIAAGGWPHRLTRGTQRIGILRNRFPEAPGLARLVRAVDGYTDTDFDLLLTVADWFSYNDPAGLTPRQVPIPGIHAKWLNSHQPHILTLTGKANLGLLPPHSPRIHFTYLDPDYRATGRRAYDSATVGDTSVPAYQPQVVIISENKDTAIHFPLISSGISVEGDGFGGKTAAAFPWLVNADSVHYWGDIDAYGYEILNGWRADGVPVTSILMDPATYETYEPYGTNTDAKGRPLEVGIRKPLPHLTVEERAVYEHITDPTCSGHRRIEQERIPLREAYHLVCEQVWSVSVDGPRTAKPPPTRNT